MRAKHWMPDRLIRSTATFGRKRHWTHATEPAVPPLTLGISNPETAEPLIIWPTSPPGRTATIGLRDSSCLRVDRYNDQASGRALIEIRLCNERATPMPIPIGLWMFQTKLHVNAGGADVFLPVCDVLEQDLAERDEEVRQLNLQYRNRLEYAIGRTCSAAWSVNGSRRPSAVWTTWLPVAETPHTRARSVENALLSMDSRGGVT